MKITKEKKILKGYCPECKKKMIITRKEYKCINCKIGVEYVK